MSVIRGSFPGSYGKGREKETTEVLMKSSSDKDRGVAERAGHRCEYCGAPEAVFNFPFEVEHIIPPAQGGTDDASNRALACNTDSPQESGE
jgi:hypothetical protein